MEWPQWSTVLKWHRIATHLQSIGLGSHFQYFAVTPSAVPLQLSSLPSPPHSPIRGAPRCKKQATALNGPDAATTPRNIHPTSQSGRCSRDIACLIGRGAAAGVASPLSATLCHRAPLLICTPFPRPRLCTPSSSSPRAPASYLYVAFPCGETWPRFPGLGTLHRPRRTHPSTPYNFAGWTGCPFLARSGFPSLVPSLLP